MGIEQENPFHREPMWPNVTPEEDAVLKKNWGSPKAYIDEESESTLTDEKRDEKLFGLPKDDIDNLYSGNDNSELYGRNS